MKIHFLKLTRRLASRHSNLPLKYPTNREDVNNVLNLTQSRIADELKADFELYKSSNVSKKVQVNNFLHALLKNDFKKAVSCIEIFGSKCLLKNKMGEYERLYVSCLISLLTYILKDLKTGVRLKDLNNISHVVAQIPSVVSMRNADDIDEIKTLTLIAFLKSLKGLGVDQALKRLRLITQVKLLAKAFMCDEAKLLRSITREDIDVLEQYKMVFKKNSREMKRLMKTSQLSVEKYKDENGNLSFNALCSFLEEQSFIPTPSDASSDFKLYEIYENLSQKEKEQFMKEYLAFNKEKQCLIEEHSRNINKFPSFKGQVRGFTNLHTLWLIQWHCVVSDAIGKLMLMDRFSRKFSFIVSHLTKEALATLLLSYIMTSTIPTVHIKVLSLAKRLSYGITSEMRKLKVFSSTHQFYDLFFEEELIRFLCEMIQIVVTNCTLPKSDLVGSDIYDVEEFEDKVFLHKLARHDSGQASRKIYGVIKLHPFIAENFKSYQDFLRTGSFQLPMVHPPQSWTSPNNGGFLTYSIPLVISSQPKSYSKIMALAHNTGQMSSIYESLNALGSTMWAVNPFTFDKFSIAFENGNLKNLISPSLAKVNDVLEGLEREVMRLKTLKKSDNELKLSRALYDKQLRDRISLEKYYGLVHAFALSLSQKGEMFYLPHHLDFRGRAYPSVSFLSHHSDDLVRSLLMFWQSKELGPEGFNWLKYQLSNMFNKTKLSMKDLIAFVETNRQKIIDSVEETFTGEMWWTLADNPWQTLALCNEITSVWNFDGPVSNFRSRIPVHQDGTCNGLQHYSALSGDTLAAHSVNVLPGSERRDIYSTILSLVKSRVLRDQDNCEEVSRLSRLVTPLLERKIIKQTVMTTVYGVTLYGATRQISNQLEDKLLSSGKIDEFSNKDLSNASSYVARHVLLSINDLFGGAKLIQSWLLNNCMRCIQSFPQYEFSNAEVDFFSRKHYQPFMWTSLSGFPVVQYYRKVPSITLTSSLQSVNLRSDKGLCPIDSRKLINGVAPNFIHSIDAIHLLMTCLASKTDGITFAAIHDCFWTHASDVSGLSSQIRRQFIRLHKSNIMKNIRDDLIHVTKNNLQLVWIDIAQNRLLCKEIDLIRAKYPLHGKNLKLGLPSELRTKSILNAVMRQEISNPQPLRGLLAKYNPELIFNAIDSRQACVYNRLGALTERNSRITFRTHIPLLVPVLILDIPVLGTLDIESVHDSVYFFS